MKIFLIVAFTAIVLMQSASANFDIYRHGMSGGGIGGNAWGWAFYDKPPNCDEAVDWMWGDWDDVSHSTGVRCEGNGCAASGDPSDIDVLEMNFRAYHWSESCP